MTPCLKIACLNVAGLAGKWDEIDDILLRYDIDIIFLCETWMAPNSRALDSRFVCHSPFPTPNRKGRSSYGVAFAVHQKYAESLHRFKELPSPNSGLSCSIRLDDNLTVCGLYVPPKLSEDDTIRIVRESIDGMTGHTILLGDWNMRLGSMTGDRIVNARGNYLLPFLETQTLGFSLCPTFNNSPTFFTPDFKGSSTPDHVFSSSCFFANWVESSVLSDEDAGGTDHRVLVSTFIYENKQEPHTPKEKKRLQLHRLKTEKYSCLYNATLHETLQRTHLYDALSKTQRDFHVINVETSHAPPLLYKNHDFFNFSKYKTNQKDFLHFFNQKRNEKTHTYHARESFASTSSSHSLPSTSHSSCTSPHDSQTFGFIQNKNKRKSQKEKEEDIDDYMVSKQIKKMEYENQKKDQKEKEKNEKEREKETTEDMEENNSIQQQLKNTGNYFLNEKQKEKENIDLEKGKEKEKDNTDKEKEKKEKENIDFEKEKDKEKDNTDKEKEKKEKENIEKKGKKEKENIEKKNDILTSLIINTAHQTLGLRVLTHTHKPKLYTEALQNARRTRRKAFKNIKKITQHTPQNTRENLINEYLDAKENEKKKLKEAKREAFYKFGDKLHQMPVHEQMKLMRNIKKSRTTNGQNILKNDNTAMDLHKNYFKNLFALSEEHVDTGHEDTTNNVMDARDWNETWDRVFKPERIHRLIMKMPNGKAPGLSDVSWELLKHAPPLLFTELSSLFKEVSKSGSSPSSWRSAVIHPLFKKGDPRNIENYRPISLTDNFRKLYERCINRLVSKYLEPLDITQGGFRARRSTMDQIVCLKAMMEERRRSLKRYPILAFLDIKAAYDSVHRPTLWKKLSTRGMPATLLRILQSLFDDVTSRVRIQGETSQSFPNERGLLQGSILSPILYATYIDDLAKRLRSKARGKLWDLEISCLFYADDIVVVADDYEHLQELLNVCETHAKENFYFFAPTKCAVVRHSEVPDGLATLHGVPLPEVKSFQYLGFPVTETGPDGFEHAIHLASALRKQMNFFSSIGFNGSGLSLNSRLHIARTFLRPTLEYGLALLQKQQMNPINRAFNNMLQCMFSTSQRTSIEKMLILSGLPTMELRRRTLATYFQIRARQRNKGFTIHHAYYQQRSRPHRSSLLNNIRGDPLLFGPAEEARERVKIEEEKQEKQRISNQKIRWSNYEKLAVLRRHLDTLKDRRASHALSLWMFGVPYGIPKRCLKCNIRLDNKHATSCIADIDQFLFDLKVSHAALSLKKSYEMCLHQEIFWSTSANPLPRKKKPP
jgi:hypothetical protein